MQLQIDAHCVGYDTRMNQLLELLAADRFFCHVRISGHLLGHGGTDARLRAGAGGPSCAHRQLQDHAHRHRLAVVLSSWAQRRCCCTISASFNGNPRCCLGLTAAAFLGSMAVGKQPLVRRMLEAALREPLADLDAHLAAVQLVSGLRGLRCLAAANLYVARNFAEGVWVKFKVFGIHCGDHACS